MRKIILTFFLIFTSVLHLSLAEEGITPEILQFADNAECVVDSNTTRGDCDGFSQSCEVAESIGPAQYGQCIRDICGEGAPSILGEVQAIQNQAQELIGQVERELGAELNSLTTALEDQVKETKNQIEQSETIKNDLTRELTLNLMIDDFSSLLMGSFPNGYPRDVNVLIQNKDTHFPGWKENQIRIMHSILQKKHERISSPGVLDSLNEFFASAEKMRQAVGALERRSRDLPENSLRKEELVQGVFQLQSSLQLHQDQPLSGDFKSSSVSLFTKLLLEEVNYQDIGMQTMRTLLYESRGGFEVSPNVESPSFGGLFKDGCLAMVSEQVAKLPTRENRVILLAKINQTKNEVLNNARSKLSSKTFREFEKGVNDMSILIPPAREDFMSRLKGLFKEKAGYLKSRNDTEAAFSGYRTYAQGIDEMAEEHCTLPFDGGASAFASSAVGDGLGHDHSRHISIGGALLRDYEGIAKSIVGHEIGHIFSHILKAKGSLSSKMKDTNIRNCLKSNHSQNAVSHLFPFIEGLNGNKLKQEEEDFADLFAFRLLPSTTNPACSFFKNGVPFYSGSNTLTPSQETSHSPDLFRLFHGEAVRGENLPNSCKLEMSQLGEERSIQNCWR